MKYTIWLTIFHPNKQQRLEIFDSIAYITCANGNVTFHDHSADIVISNVPAHMLYQYMAVCEKLPCYNERACGLSYREQSPNYDFAPPVCGKHTINLDGENFLINIMVPEDHDDYSIDTDAYVYYYEKKKRWLYGYKWVAIGKAYATNVTIDQLSWSMIREELKKRCIQRTKNLKHNTDSTIYL